MTNPNEQTAPKTGQGNKDQGQQARGTDSVRPDAPSKDQGSRQADQRSDRDPQRIEIPGRHGIETETDKSKAYGPGGGRVVNDADRNPDRNVAKTNPETGGQEDPDRTRPEPVSGGTNIDTARTAPGADTVPL